MDYREYGRTGKKFPQLVLAVCVFQKKIISQETMKYSVKIIHRAHELGVNYFDTAPDYCDEHSEDILDKHFKHTAVHFMFLLNVDCGMPLMAMRQEKFWKNPLPKWDCKNRFFHIWAIKQWKITPHI
ncbi:MAG: hypothetical protein ACLR13_08370 [Acutalibacteraceae bacterium]